MSDKGLSSRALATQFGVGRTQIQNCLKRKAEVLSDFENNAPRSRKRKLRKTGNEAVNDKCWDWCLDAVARQVPISGPMIQEKALQIARVMGNEEFKASNGWLESFLKRNNLTLGKHRGESDLTVCESRQAESSLTETVEPVATSTPPPHVDDSSESETEDVHESRPPTFQEARDAIALLRRFALHTGSTTLLDSVMALSDQLSSVSAMHMRQKKLGDYFSVSASSRK
nr:hypothetical protein BaRGS_028233 [Batillaria attramentaria]